MTLRALLAVLLCAGAIGAMTWRATRDARRPVERQEVVRLVEAARADDAECDVTWTAPEIQAVEPPLVQSTFPSDLDGWTFLPSAQETLTDDIDHDAWLEPATTRYEAMHFKQGRGHLARIVPATPGELLQLDVQARVRRPRGSEETSSLDPLTRTLAGVLPLNQEVGVDALLGATSLFDLWQDTERRWLCLGAPPPTFVTEPFDKGTLQRHRVRFPVPPDARSLLLVFWNGAPETHEVDLHQVGLRRLTAREAAALGPGPKGRTARTRKPADSFVSYDVRGRPLSDQTTSGAAAKSFGVTSLAGDAHEALRTIDCLGDQRDGFVLPPPASIAFDVTLPSGPLALEFGTGFLHERRPRWRRHPVTLRVWVGEPGDDQPVLLHEREFEETDRPGWHDTELQLDAWAGRRVRLRFESDTERSDDVLVIGAPMVRRRAPHDPRPNVILVSLDTFRADRMSAEGYPRPTTPFLDELARRNQWFRAAHSTSSYTLPSHASMMSGQLPSLHGAIAPTHRLEPRRSDLLADRLRSEGYLTAAFTAGNFVGPRYGFAHGFDRYGTLDPLLTDRAPMWDLTPVAHDRAFNMAQRDGNRWDDALDWIRRHRDGRFFLFLHTFQVHEYQPTDASRELFVTEGPTADPGRFLAWKNNKTRDARTMSDADLALGEDLYDATVRDADNAIAALVDTLRRQRLWYDTVLVVTSDHGEEFLERGRLGHGRSLHQEQLHVPLIIHLPGDRPSQVIREPVSLVDIAPTILDALGLAPPKHADGRSLLSLIDDGAATSPSPPLFAELDLTPAHRWTAVIDGPWKLLRSGHPMHEEVATEAERLLYHLEVDPSETRPLQEEVTDRRDVLQSMLRERLIDATALRGDLGGTWSELLSPAELERLRRIGYSLESEGPTAAPLPPNDDATKRDETSEAEAGSQDDGR